MKTLNELRKEKCIKVQRMAYELGVAERTYYLWEKKDKFPSLPNALAIAKYLGVAVEDIDWGC